MPEILAAQLDGFLKHVHWNPAFNETQASNAFDIIATLSGDEGPYINGHCWLSEALSLSAL